MDDSLDFNAELWAVAALYHRFAWKWTKKRKINSLFSPKLLSTLILGFQSQFGHGFHRQARRETGNP